MEDAEVAMNQAALALGLEEVRCKGVAACSCTVHGTTKATEGSNNAVPGKMNCAADGFEGLPPLPSVESE